MSECFHMSYPQAERNRSTLVSCVSDKDPGSPSSVGLLYRQDRGWKRLSLCWPVAGAQ